MTKSALLSSAVLFAAAASLPAQWNEVGDAGDLPRTAQIPGTPTLTLPSIVGSLSVANDVDMYLVYIANPAAFTATTVGGASFDTQLWLFHADGRGVAFNDDSTGTQSSLTAAFVPHPGLYYLAVSGYDNDPLAMGGQIWLDSPFASERAPDGGRQGEQVDGWSGFGASGAYTIALTGCERPRKQIVAPDNHHLTETAAVTLPGGSTTWWRAAGGRFQVLYDASHFQSAGMTGAWIDKLFFRGEDGEANAGGQSWAGVTVQLARTSMTPATMGTDFAANLAAASALSPIGTIATVTAARSAGTFPNNYNIELDLYAAFTGWFYDSTLGNLLIDVTLPSAATLPANGTMMAMQDTTGGLAVVRGAGINAAIGATTGALSVAPPVIGFGIDGAGGGAPPIVATNESYGAACGGSPSTFYQAFRNGQAFDLGAGLTLTPDNAAAPNYYVVTGGAGAFDPSKVNAAPNSAADDATVAHTLGFTHAFPGGSTTAIRPCTNGYVWLDGTSATADFSPTVAEFLGSATTSLARYAPFWMDFHCGLNITSHPNSGLHVLTDTSGGAGNAVCYVTWLNCSAFNAIVGGNSVNNMQVVIYEATRVVEFRYGSMPRQAQTGSENCFVGFTRGRIGTTSSVNPQSRDLSLEVPFQTSVEGTVGNMLQTVAATPTVGGAIYGGRAFAGQTLTFNVAGAPAGALIGAQLIDIAANRPGINLPGIHPTGCVQGVTLSPTLFEVSVFPPATITGTVPLVVPPGVEGFELFAQYAMLDGLFGAPTLTTAFSNAVRIRVGKN